MGIEFKTAPVQIAEATAMIGPWQPNFETLATLEKALFTSGATVLPPPGTTQGATELALGGRAILRAEDPNSGLQLEVFYDTIVARWIFSPEHTYPGFGALAQILSECLNLIPNELHVCRLSYRLLETRQRRLADLFVADWIPGIALNASKVFETSVNYRTQSGVDYRLGTLSAEEGIAIITDGGLLPEGNPGLMPTLITVHNTMLEEFASATTDLAKDLWSFTP